MLTRNIIIRVIQAFLIFFLFCSCSGPREKLLLAVSIPPQAWFVSQIADDKAGTVVLVGPGQNPHNYEPSPRQIQSLAQARAWILSGCEFEISLLPKVKSLFPNLLIVDGTEGARFRYLEEHDDHEHSSLEIDRHTWLGREPAKILASHIKDTLSFFDSENEEYYTQRYEKLVIKIDDEFDSLKIILEPLKGRNVFVYHPSFGYFLDEFDIHQEAVETGGKEPGPRLLNDLVMKLNKENAAAIFIQAQFPVNAAKTLANAVNAELISLDPLAYDWLENIRLMGNALQNATLQRAIP
jgi:zinc transport system substrate-binding protein